jgi:hypothetical protein
VQVLNVAGHQRLARSASAVSICTFVPVKQAYWDLQVYQRRGPRAPRVAVDLFVFCTSEISSKLTSKLAPGTPAGGLRALDSAAPRTGVSICTFVPVKQVLLYQ